MIYLLGVLSVNQGCQKSKQIIDDHTYFIDTQQDITVYK